MRRRTYIAIMTIQAILGWCLLIGAYWILYPYGTIVIQNPDALKVLNSPHQGEAVVFHINFCKQTDDVITVHRYLHDGQIFTLQDTVGALPKGCGSYDVANTFIPANAPPGEYYLEYVDEFHPNPLRTIYVRYRTEPFTVLYRPQTLQVIIDGVPSRVQVTKPIK